MRADLGPRPRAPTPGRSRLANAIQCGNTQEILKRMVLNVPRMANKRGILRMDYIKRVIVENYNALGFGARRATSRRRARVTCKIS